MNLIFILYFAMSSNAPNCYITRINWNIVTNHSFNVLGLRFGLWEWLHATKFLLWGLDHVLPYTIGIHATKSWHWDETSMCLRLREKLLCVLSILHWVVLTSPLCKKIDNWFDYVAQSNFIWGCGSDTCYFDIGPFSLLDRSNHSNMKVAPKKCTNKWSLVILKLLFILGLLKNWENFQDF